MIFIFSKYQLHAQQYESMKEQQHRQLGLISIIFVPLNQLDGKHQVGTSYGNTIVILDHQNRHWYY